jgi:hypothetical protein
VTHVGHDLSGGLRYDYQSGGHRIPNIHVETFCEVVVYGDKLIEIIGV